MEMRTRNSTFSQFSSDLWCVFEHEGAKVHFEVDQRELLPFAEMLLGLACDALNKSTIDTEKETDLIYSTIDALWNLLKDAKNEANR